MEVPVPRSWLDILLQLNEMEDEALSSRYIALEDAAGNVTKHIHTSSKSSFDPTSHRTIAQTASSKASDEQSKTPLPRLEGGGEESACCRFTVVERIAPWQNAQDVYSGETEVLPWPVENEAQTLDMAKWKTDVTDHQVISTQEKLALKPAQTVEAQAAIACALPLDDVRLCAETSHPPEVCNANIPSAKDQVNIEEWRIGMSKNPPPSTRTPPAPLIDRLSTLPPHKPCLSRLPLEILRYVVEDLDEISKICLKYTNSHFHTIIRNKCAKSLNYRGRRDLIARVELDAHTHRALLLCFNCKLFTLRKLVHGRTPNRRWMLSRLSYREERRSCCKTVAPPGSTALSMSQFGASNDELKSAERMIDVDNPGMALLLICLHCSAEIPFTGEDVQMMECSRCRCKHCPLVFMPRHLSLSVVEW